MERPRIPEWFERELARQFGGQLRLRWSREKSRFLVERRWRAGRAPKGPRDSQSDRVIQHIDGVYTVCEVTPGDRTRCPKCNRDTKIPVRQWTEAKCEHCAGTFRAVFYPLGEDLLQHLRWSDPDRGGIERVFAEAEAGEQARERARKRAFQREHEAVWKEDYNRLVGIPQWGYTGREMVP